MITGKQAERKQFTNDLLVGFFEAKVVSICPDKEELLTLLNVSEENASKFKDPVYTEEVDGVDKAYVDVWLEDVKSKTLFNKRFFLEKRIRKSKDDIKTQYINNIGLTTWTIREEDLPEWFNKRDFRKAYAGEELLYDFLRNWLGNLDMKSPETEIALDNKKLFAGNFKELQNLIDSPLTSTVVAMAEVKSREVDGGLTEKQSIYDRFLPGYTMRTLAGTRFNQDNIDAWRRKMNQKSTAGERIYLKNYEKYVCSLTDGEYGSRNHFLLEPLQKYDSSKNNGVSSAAVITNDEPDF